MPSLAIAAIELESKESTGKNSKYNCADVTTLDTDDGLESCTTTSNKSLVNMQSALLKRHKKNKNFIILLTNMQGAWIEFRDAQCEYMGRNSPVKRDGARAMLRCEIQQTMARVEAIKAL